MLYTEHPFLDRFAAAATDGFRAVEYLGPYDHPPAGVPPAATGAGLEQALVSLPSGDWAGGERGLGGLPGREEELRAGVETAIRYAQALGCGQLNRLAGITPAGAEVRHEAVLIENL